MLPDWIKQDADKAHRFHIDADAAYTEVMPAVLKALGTDTVDQYTIEVAYNFIKWDFDVALKAADLRFDCCVERKIGGGEGYKTRWGLNAHQPGRHAAVREKEGEQAFGAIVGKEARAIYKKARGFVPA